MGKKSKASSSTPTVARSSAAKKVDLFGDEEEEEVTLGNGVQANGGSSDLTINSAYAERYDNWRRLEEMQKMKDKYGDAFRNDDYESEESEESDDGADWTPSDEKDFLKTLSALKGDEEKIYDKSAKFWSEKKDGESSASAPKEKKEKPMYLRDYERKLVERGGDIDESNDEEDMKKEAEPGYLKQQEMNKRALKKAMGTQSDSDNDDLLVKREKTVEQEKREEDEYYEWIAGNKDRAIADHEKKELKSLQKAWSASNMDANEKFLRDYILNKQYDTDREGAHVPSYEEIVGTTLEEDEKEEEKGRDFERKFNFRFEEPDQDFVSSTPYIKQYPRSIAASVREGAQNKRADKRQQLKERKAREKEEKVAEIRQLKKMKKTEIERKLSQLKKLAGDDVPVSLDDLDGDFDPAEYDKRMQSLFDAKYYDKEVDETEKPVFSDLSDDDEGGVADYDNLPARGGGDISDSSESEDNSDDDDDDDDDSEDDAGTTTKKPSKAKKDEKPKKSQEVAEESLRREKDASSRRRKRNSKFLEAVNRPKPLFDPKEKTFEEYFNEYYALDYEDILGDTRTRFKYRSVPANNFGLSTEEILNADDRQLNAWASLKKAVAYRSEKEEQYDISVYTKKGKDQEKKDRLFSLDFGGKRSKKAKAAEEAAKKAETEGAEKANGAAETNGESSKTKKKKNKKKKTKNAGATEKQDSAVADGAGEDEAGEGEPGEGESKEHADGGEAKDTNGKKAKPAAGDDKKKGRSRKRRKVDTVDVGVEDARLRAYGINVKKFKASKVYGKKKGEQST